MVIRSVVDIEVYRRAYQAAMAVFRISRSFPDEERYSLTDQLVRSSRSVAANIREGFAKREYENVFFRHLVDALGSAEETQR
jgi:four helix bundle protein